MKKYVAFLDILGFKNKLKQLGQESAKQYISAFSSTAYHEWEKFASKYVEGYIVSDSFIIYTQKANEQTLLELLTIIDNICKKEFSDNKILIRGAIAKGEFERMPAVELSSLSKGLMVGQAYVDAYALEDSAKIAGILLTQEVYDDMQELDSTFECSEEKSNDGFNYVMRYLDFSFLSEQDNLMSFVNLATESNWLPHYYNTLYFAIKGERNNRKVYDFFDNVISCFGDPSEFWPDIDKFIKNAFDKDVIGAFQKRFLGFIRERTVKRIERQSHFISKPDRPSNMERVLSFIEARGNVTLSQVSSTLGLSPSTTSRVIKELLNEEIIKSTSEIENVGTGRRSINTYSVRK